MEYWSIELWENEDGVCRADKDLLKKMENFQRSQLRDKMEKYTKEKIENTRRSGYLEKVKSELGMWELKFSLLKSEIRFLGCLTLKNELCIYYALYAFQKKDQKIMNKHRKAARVRIKEFINNFKQNELQKIL